MVVRFGEHIRAEIYGQSHADRIGVRIEGLPAGRPIDTAELQRFLDRRAPGRNAWSTSRKEGDRPEFLSGVSRTGAGFFETDGNTLEAVIYNTNIRPQDYKDTKVVPRPAHADYPAWVRYGEIASGGGQFSARMTAPLCIAGGIFLQWLNAEGIGICAHIASIGDICDVSFPETEGTACRDAGEEPLVDPEFPVIDRAAGEEMKALIARTKSEGDSIGGIIECMITGLRPGIGSPLFGSIESRLCQTVFAVPAVKGIEFGSGFGAARMRGSENNDPFCIRDGRVETKSNHHGGILGGLSSGMPILFRTAMKPTPSIAREQTSVDLETMTETVLTIKGRHDPCIVPRAVPCIEAAAALAIGDLLLMEDQL